MSDPLKPLHVQAQADVAARITARDYLCANCWKHLILFPAPERKWFVLCATCGVETRGYASKSGVEKRRQQDLGDYLDVRNNYRHLKPARRNAGDAAAKKELGYGGR